MHSDAAHVSVIISLIRAEGQDKHRCPTCEVFMAMRVQTVVF
jgi:hypothetical protein